eukprot:TRINITY_DN40339_c0_g1_i1.p1 TRINITY_DN40339_c0_g1~~TRINITY_DN40339_c0_g1_i1.p1  ORF type:complete len:286 (+),score=62.74 TRINITY_DN40339_c0_g1_i1:82-939(+)
MIRRPPRSTLSSSSAASDVYKRQDESGDESGDETRISKFFGSWTHRWDVEDIPPTNKPYVVIGCIFLWYGWYGFNVGSVQTLSSNNDFHAITRISISTTLCPSVSALTAFALKSYIRWDVMQMMSAGVAGLVAISAPCAVVHPAFSIPIGIMAFGFHKFFRYLAVACWVDDPVDAFAVHFGGGLAGFLAVVFFADASLIAQVYANRQYSSDVGGLFYVGYPYLFFMQLLGGLCLVGWSALWSFSFFWTMNRAGKLRIRFADEQVGVDISKEHGEAYPYFSLKKHR